MVDYVTAGDIYLAAQNTKQPNTTDLSMRTAFGWTGVPVIICDKYGAIIEYELEFKSHAFYDQEAILLVVDFDDEVIQNSAEAFVNMIEKNE